jgi:hypothetical protein
LLGWVKDDAEYIAERISAFDAGQNSPVAQTVEGLLVPATAEAAGSS